MGFLQWKLEKKMEKVNLKYLKLLDCLFISLVSMTAEYHVLCVAPQVLKRHCKST